MIFFTADLHLGHNNIIKHCYRPFPSVEEMDSTLIANINAKVGSGDLLYIIGDFSLGNFERVKEQRSMLRCGNVFLIKGNHDRLSKNRYEDAGFLYKGDLCELSVYHQPITLCHYAMRRWNKSHYGAWHLFGHSHGHLKDDPTLFSFDVGVDCHNYAPLSFDEVKDIMNKRTLAVAEPNHDAV